MYVFFTNFIYYDNQSQQMKKYVPVQILSVRNIIKSNNLILFK